MSNDRVDVDWESARATNLENWEDRVPLHEASYPIAELDDPDHLSDIVRADLAALEPYVPNGTVAG